MKLRKQIKRLERRQQDYDERVSPKVTDPLAWHRPGSNKR